MHMVVEADLYDLPKAELKGRPWVSVYWDATNRHLVEAVPTWSPRYVVPRWQTVSGSQYAHSPAAIVALPDARMIQAMARTLIEVGEKVANPPMIATEEAIRSAIGRFQGRVAQVPPMYSAVKVGGVPLYKAARAGRTVERESREITVHGIEVQGIAGRDVSLLIRCSKGTYIRTLCADIGAALGVGGHLLALERRRVGPLTIERALTVEEVEARLSFGHLEDEVISLDAALAAVPAVIVDEATALRTLHGVPVPWRAAQWADNVGVADGRGGQTVRVKDRAGRLLALGRAPQDAGAEIAILKVLAEGNPQPA